MCVLRVDRVCNIFIVGFSRSYFLTKDIIFLLIFTSPVNVVYLNKHKFYSRGMQFILLDG